MLYLHNNKNKRILSLLIFITKNSALISVLMTVLDVK